MLEILFAIIGVATGAGGFFVYNQQKGNSGAQKADKEIASAKNKAGDIV